MSDPTASLAALDREIDAVEEILKSWNADTPSAINLPKIETRPRSATRQKLDPLLTGLASIKNRLVSVERQISLLLLAQVTFFVSATIAALWSLTSQGEWLVGHLIGVSITGQVCTLFCLAWFLAKLRLVQEKVGQTEVMILRSKKDESSQRASTLPAPKLRHKSQESQGRATSTRSGS